ncbi:hypothetical protein HanRHA438_Chr14g0660951 [Helianthus annuus]|nr:hypothetical protein HanIR_Chr14g0705281 [Helianthus annuus]KAJ0854286.1 hypothetical protein HanRHA438_Chr14g0660951 [Helianthus annuus]
MWVKVALLFSSPSVSKPLKTTTATVIARDSHYHCRWFASVISTNSSCSIPVLSVEGQKLQAPRKTCGVKLSCHQTVVKSCRPKSILFHRLL